MVIWVIKIFFVCTEWSRSVVSDSATPWTVAYQASLFMGFSKQEFWSGLPFPPPGDLPDPGLSFILPIFAWSVPLVCLILLKRYLVFPILLFSSISLHWSLRKASSLLAILWNSVFRWVYLSFSALPFTSLLFSAICKGSSDNHCAFLCFFLGGRFWSPPLVQCYEPPPIVLQALCLQI